MTPRRISAKLFATDPTADVDLHAFIPVFHEFIREKTVEGLLIDVADYSHVPEGPGVVLIGHDVDYSTDLGAGQAGLLTVTKRIEAGEVADLLDDAVRKCLLAAKAVRDNGSTGMTFSTEVLRVQVIDRLVARNCDESYALFQSEFEALARRLFGGGGSAARADVTDSRRVLAAELRAANAEDLDTLLVRLER